MGRRSTLLEIGFGDLAVIATILATLAALIAMFKWLIS